MSKQETAGIVRKALDDARMGRATLGQLGSAHDLATSSGLTGCVGELRQHMIRMANPSKTTDRPRTFNFLSDVVAGVIAGYFTHHLIG